jgi:REP element-mobilizing transposase RayT
MECRRQVQGEQGHRPPPTITVNTLARGQNQLANPAVFAAVKESAPYRQKMGQWRVQYLLLMPDHLHALVSFAPDVPMTKAVTDWKRFLARKCGIVWQDDFFDHRIRQDESHLEKWEYIRQNPLRKGLAAIPDEWPYQWMNDEEAGSSHMPNAWLVRRKPERARWWGWLAEPAEKRRPL